MHNHPGWRRKSLEHPEFEVKAYGEGLIDGIEIMNGAEFYPKAIARAHARKLFVTSTMRRPRPTGFRATAAT